MLEDSAQSSNDSQDIGYQPNEFTTEMLARDQYDKKKQKLEVFHQASGHF